MTTGRGEVDRNGTPQSPRLKQNELTARLDQVVQYGVVEEVDHSRGRARVRTTPQDDQGNGRLSNWIPWSTGNSDSGNGNWNPLQIGAQVAMLAPSGDAAQALILPGVYSDGNPPPSKSEHEYVQSYEDGTTIKHNKDTSAYEMVVPAGGQLTISCGSSSITITDGEIILTTPKFTGVQG